MNNAAKKKPKKGPVPRTSRAARNGSMRSFSIAEARNKLSSLVKQAEQGPIQLTRRGEPVVLMVSAEEYFRRPNLYEAIQEFRATEDPEDLFDENPFAKRLK